MNRFLSAALGLAMGICAGPLRAEHPQPNIALILVDDQGYYELGCYGASEFKTPNIDRMAAETHPVRNGKMLRKLRGMSVLFQEEMRTGARLARATSG